MSCPYHTVLSYDRPSDHTNAIKYKEATQAKLKAQYKADAEAKAKVSLFTISDSILRNWCRKPQQQ